MSDWGAVFLWAAGESGVDAGDVSLLCRSRCCGRCAGREWQGPRFVQATLAEDVAGKAGLTRMLPAGVSMDRVRPEVRLVGWQGSGDLAANARANCYAVLPPSGRICGGGCDYDSAAVGIGYEQG